MKKIIPVILTNNLEDLKNKSKQLKGLTDWVQIDIMDGKFVKNISIKLRDLLKIRTRFNLEAHLMVLNPEKYLADCRKVGIKRVLFHFEATDQPLIVLEKIKRMGFEAGLALNPETPIKKIKPYLNKLDVVLILGVHPGFSGQMFIFSTFDRIRQLRDLSRQVNPVRNGEVLDIPSLKNLKIDITSPPQGAGISNGVKIEVDGGINLRNIQKIVRAGADYLVISSALFKSKNIKQTFKQFKKMINCNC